MDLKNSVKTQEEKAKKFLKNYLAFLRTQNDAKRLLEDKADVLLRRRKLKREGMK